MRYSLFSLPQELLPLRQRAHGGLHHVDRLAVAVHYTSEVLLQAAALALAATIEFMHREFLPGAHAHREDVVCTHGDLAGKEKDESGRRSEPLSSSQPQVRCRAGCPRLDGLE